MTSTLREHIDLSGKVALVTGGTSGIGLAAAHQLKAQGATVLITGRSPQGLERARKELGEDVEAIPSDAGDEKAVKALFDLIKREHGQIDVLFLNAGVALFAPLSDARLEDFDTMWSINVRGPWLALKHAGPLLSENASVIMNTSVVNQKGMPGTSAYAATKAALRSLVRTSAAELAQRKIRVNAVSPGPIDTPIYSKLGLPKEALDSFADDIIGSVPLGAMGRPEDIASAVGFLASPASAFITGTELAVDGGLGQV